MSNASLHPLTPTVNNPATAVVKTSGHQFAIIRRRLLIGTVLSLRVANVIASKLSGATVHRCFATVEINR